MNRTALYLSAGLFFVLIQTSFLSAFPIRPLKPEFLLILTIYLALHESLVKGGVLVYLLGCLYDASAGSFLGLHGLTLLLLYFSTRIIASRMNTESSSALLLLVGLGTILHAFNLFFALAYFADVVSSLSLIVRQLFPQILLNLLAAGLLVMFFNALQRYFPRLIIPGIQHLDDN